ncbi:MAG TPA: hypothetical protein VGL81_24000 [Polyangiaceae bacterium]|jgi:hypothetical protein
MNLAAVLRRLPATARRYEPTFQCARVGTSAFFPYATVTALFDALSIDGPVPTAERQELVRAIVRLHRAGRSPLWQALLLHAFGQMLRGLRWRDVGQDEDRDQRVLLAFMQGLERVRLDGQPVFLAMRRATERALFRAVRAQARAVDTVPLGAQPPRGGEPHEDPWPFVACLAHELAERVGERSGGADVSRVLAGVETIGEQVRRLAREGRGARERPITTSTLRQRRHRAVTALRRELASDPAEPA